MMDGNNLLVSYLIEHNIKFQENVDLKLKTWIHRGGFAHYYLMPSNADELESLCSFLYKQKLDFLVVGHTSNMYFLNNCEVDVLVSAKECRSFSIEGDFIYCECGAAVASLAKKCVVQGIAGFDSLTLLPGTVAGAIVNNSTRGEGSISALIERVEYIDDLGDKGSLRPSDFQFTYRSSVFKTKTIKGVITRVYLRKHKGSLCEIEKKRIEAEAYTRNFFGTGAQSLGCTVNQCFSSGRMPMRYRIPFSCFCRIVSCFTNDEMKRGCWRKKFLLFISGYSKLSPYISDSSMIIFKWVDERADELFPVYLQFMRDVFKTSSLEIQLVK